MAEAQFCTQCGAQLVADASFCVECGTPIGRKAGPRHSASLVSRYAPAAVVGGVLLVAAGVVVIGVLNPKQPLSVPSQRGGGQPAAPGQLPQGHPPIAVPDDVKQSIRDLAKAAQAQPDNLQLWKQLGDIQYRAGHVEPAYFVEAQQTFQHVLDREPENPDVLRSLGNIAFDRDQYEMSIDYYKRYLVLKPKDPNVQTDLATMQMSAGKTEEAIASYEQVVSENPTFFQAQFNLGLAYHQSGKTAEAIAALEKARGKATDERTRTQVEQALARMKGTPPVANAPADGAAPAAAANTLRAGVESFFRTNQILGPKLDRFDWNSDNSVRVLVRDFPLAAMPEDVRQAFSQRIRDRLKEQKAAHHVSGTLQLQVVDSATGEVLETLTE